MKVHELRESRYLAKEDVSPSLGLTIKSVEKENVAMEGEEARDKYVMFFEELPKGLVLNMTNGQIMGENFGSDDSDDWIGRRVELFNDPNVMFGGKRMGGIRVRSTINQPSTASVNEDLRQANREAQAAAVKVTARKRTRTPQPHPNEVRSAEERQKLATKGFGNAEARPEDDDDGIPF